MTVDEKAIRALPHRTLIVHGREDKVIPVSNSYQLLDLLEKGESAQGVRIFIGGESQLVPLDEFSIVTAPYEVDGQVVGTVGVIGPTRMAYERVIPIVDITAKLLGAALNSRS